MSSKSNNKKNKSRNKSSRGQVNQAVNKKTVLAYLPSITLAAAAILIFYPPFLQGLFFPREMFITHILTGLVLFLVIFQKWRQRDLAFLRTPLDWAVAAFTLAYLISLIGAVHPGEAWYGFLKVLNYFAIYLIISNIIRNFEDIETLARVLVASGVGVAVIGILAALGHSDYPGAFQSGAIYSTLQYSNTTAAFLAVMSLIAAGLWTRERNRSLKFIYLLAIAIMTLVVLATFSKGAWLIYGAGAVLLIIGMPGVYRFKAIYGLIASSVTAAATFQKLYPAITAESASAAVYLLIGAGVVLAAVILWEVLEYLYRSKGAVTVALTTILLLIIISIPLGVFGQELLREQNITQELSELLDFENSSYTSRMDFNRWAWEIVKDYPINGTGSGGWNALYHQYQDYLIWTTEVHNHFMQVWVEAGTLGFIAFISIWLGLIYTICRRYSDYRHDRLPRNQWILLWGIACSALAFGMHTAIDFDLSLGSMAIFLWSLLALMNSLYRSKVKPLTIYYSLAQASIAVILAIVLVICGSSYAAAYNHSLKGNQAMQESAAAQNAQEQAKLIQMASLDFKKATSLNAANAEYWSNLAYTYALQYSILAQNQHQAANNIYEHAVACMEKAGRLKPYDTMVCNLLLNSFATMGDVDRAIKQSLEAVTANPNDIRTYDAAAQLLSPAIKNSINHEQYDKVQEYAETSMALHTRLEQRQSRVDHKRPWQGSKLEPTENMQINLGQGYYLQGNYSAAQSILKPLVHNQALPENLKEEAVVWYAATLQRTGNKVQAEELLAQIDNADSMKFYKILLEI